MSDLWSGFVKRTGSSSLDPAGPLRSEGDRLPRRTDPLISGVGLRDTPTFRRASSSRLSSPTRRAWQNRSFIGGSVHDLLMESEWNDLSFMTDPVFALPDGCSERQLRRLKGPLQLLGQQLTGLRARRRSMRRRPSPGAPPARAPAGWVSCARPRLASWAGGNTSASRGRGRRAAGARAAQGLLVGFGSEGGVGRWGEDAGAPRMAQQLSRSPVASPTAGLGPVGQPNHHVDAEHGGGLGQVEQRVDAVDGAASRHAGRGLVKDNDPAVREAVRPAHPGRRRCRGGDHHRSSLKNCACTLRRLSNFFNSGVLKTVALPAVAFHCGAFELNSEKRTLPLLLPEKIHDA